MLWSADMCQVSGVKTIMRGYLVMSGEPGHCGDPPGQTHARVRVTGEHSVHVTCHVSLDCTVNSRHSLSGGCLQSAVSILLWLQRDCCSRDHCSSPARAAERLHGPGWETRSAGGGHQDTRQQLRFRAAARQSSQSAGASGKCSDFLTHSHF